MSESANALSTETGLPTDLVHKGIGAILSFLQQQLGEDTFAKIEASIPDAASFLSRFESSPEAASGGGLLATFTGLASKLLGGGSGEVAKLMGSFSKLGFSPEQIESFLPKALAFIKAHLPADVIEQILAKFPALAKMEEASAE